MSARGASVQDWYDTADDTGGYLDSDQTLWFTTPDPAPLTITAISPTVDIGGSADNVARGAAIQVTFSEPVAPAIVAAIETDGPANAYAALTTEGVLAVPATYAFDGAGQVLTITPAAPLRYSTRHELAIQGGSAGIASWRATASLGWLVPAGVTVYEFKTIDPATLTIWATSPSDHEAFVGISVSDVAVDSDVQILFDQAVDRASFEAGFTMRECGVSSACTAPSIRNPASFTFTYVDFPNGAQKVVVDVGPMAFDSWYEITLAGGPAGIVSREYVESCSASCEGGFLPADYTILFGTRAIPPLEARLLEPAVASGVDPNTRILIEFSTDVSLPTLSEFSYYVTDETNKVLVQGFGEHPADYALGNTAEIVLSAPLDFSTRYSVVLQSSVQGTDSRFLGREVRIGFTTKLASLVLATDPADGETAVEVNLAQRDNPGAITVYFDGAVTVDTAAGVTPEMAMQVTYAVPGRGVAALVGTIDSSTPGEWRFVPDATCNVGADALDANHTYFITLTSDIWRADGSANLIGGFRAAFDSNDGPVITAVEAIADVPNNDDLVIDLLNNTDSYGGNAANDVPVISTFRVTFSRPMDISTVVADGSISLFASDNQAITLTNLNWSNGNTVLAFDVNDPTIDWVAGGKDLRFSLGHTLTLDETIRDSEGNPLAGGGRRVTFRTSRAPSVHFIADGNPKDQSHILPVTFSTSLVQTTLSDNNFFVEEHSVQACTGGVWSRMPALLDYGYDGDGAALVPSPKMLGQRCHRVFVMAGENGPRDWRGNPFPGSDGMGASYTIGVVTMNQDNTSDEVASATVVNAALLGGRDQFRVAIATNSARGNFLPTSVNPDTFFVYADSTYATPLEGHVFYDAASSQIVFELTKGEYFSAAQGVYYYKLSPGLSTTLRGSCTAALCVNNYATTPLSFTIESAAPTATFLPSDGSINVEPDAALTVTFSEPVRPETVENSLTSLSVRDGGVPIGGAWTLNGRHTAATFTPLLPLRGGKTYTIHAEAGVLDYAGNALVPGGASFTVTTSGPVLLAAVPGPGAGGVANSDAVVIDFDRKIAPASVYTSRWGGGATVLPGSLRMNQSSLAADLWLTDNAATEIWACPYVNGTQVTFEPLNLLVPGSTYWWGFDTQVTDLGGNPVVAGYAAAFTTAP